VPKNASPFVKGTKYLQAHNYAQAKEQFTLSIKRGQHVADSYADLGTLALEQLKYADAYRAYRSAVKRNPKNPGYEYYAAYSSLYAGDYSSAVSYASRYIRLASKNPAGYHLRFLAYGKLLDAKEQLKDARTVVALAPKAAFAYVDLGAALANDKQPKAAIQAFSQAIRLQPRQGLYYIDRAQAENMTRQTALVLRDLETARSLATDPKTRRQIDQAIAQVKHPSSTATP
jgi:tetratricopeptide (TPR) repeat protein